VAGGRGVRRKYCAFISGEIVKKKQMLYGFLVKNPSVPDDGG
jgi:hypothetical protein